MNSNEFTSELAERMGYNAKETADMLAALGSLIANRLTENDTVHLQGLGQFEVRKKEERVSVNPTNGKRYLVPPKMTPVFKPGSTLKNRLKTLDAHE